MTGNVKRPFKTKKEYCEENLNRFKTTYNFLPLKQIRCRLEKEWEKLYGPKKNRKVPIVTGALTKTTKSTTAATEPASSTTSTGTTTTATTTTTTMDASSPTIQAKNKKRKLETTIELLTQDNKSVGFIESKGSGTFLRLHNGNSVPWSHSTPILMARDNAHLKEITRLPFSPIL